MVIFINGRIKNKTKVEAYARRIMHHFNLLDKKVMVEINIETKLDDELHGYCYGDKTFANIHIARKSFGEKLEYEEILKTIAHELVHAKQYLKGELVAHSGQLWKGKKYGGYLTTPWEKEAYKKEHQLFAKYWK